MARNTSTSAIDHNHSADFSCSVSAVSTRPNAAPLPLYPVVVAAHFRFALPRHYRTRQHQQVYSPDAAAAMRVLRSPQLNFSPASTLRLRYDGRLSSLNPTGRQAPNRRLQPTLTSSEKSFFSTSHNVHVQRIKMMQPPNTFMRKLV